MEPTQGMGVAHFDDVLFSDRGGIERSAIFLCNDKKAHSTFKFGFVVWNTISARAVTEDVVDIFFFLFWGVAQHYLKY